MRKPMIALCLFVLAMAGCSRPLYSPRQASEAAALEAVDAFMEAFNSRDPSAFAATLNYPHARNGAGNEKIWNTPREYADEMDYGRLTARGWDHSAWDYKKIVHGSATRVHVAIQYTRYKEDGAALETRQGVYLVTNVGGHWGIQARFSGLPLAEGEAKEQAEDAATKVVEDYMAAFNSRDPEAWAETLNYPHVRVSDTGIRSWENAGEYADGFDFAAFAERAGGWDRSRWDKLDVIQASEDMALVALVFSRFNADGKKISTFNTLYLVTLQARHWGIRARSSFAP